MPIRLPSTPTRSGTVKPPNQLTRLGRGPRRPSQTRNPAAHASPALRASVGQPTGAECNWPKQWQSGVRPSARLMLMAMMKANSSESAPTAPSHADRAGIKLTATASSASGSRMPIGPASLSGTPKPARAFRKLVRSASFVAPASKNTTHRKGLASTAASSISIIRRSIHDDALANGHAALCAAAFRLARVTALVCSATQETGRTALPRRVWARNFAGRAGGRDALAVRARRVERAADAIAAGNKQSAEGIAAGPDAANAVDAGRRPVAANIAAKCFLVAANFLLFRIWQAMLVRLAAPVSAYVRTWAAHLVLCICSWVVCEACSIAALRDWDTAIVPARVASHLAVWTAQVGPGGTAKFPFRARAKKPAAHLAWHSTKVPIFPGVASHATVSIGPARAAVRYRAVKWIGDSGTH